MREIELLKEARELWNRRDFYAAHELLEDIWRLFPKEDRHSRNCYQGIIRLAIAYNHYLQGRKDSCLRVLKMVREQFQPCGEVFRFVKIAYLLDFVEEHIRLLEEGKELSSFPSLPLLTDL